MADTVPPEFLRFVAAERRAERMPAPPKPLAAGRVAEPILIDPRQAVELLRVAARRAAGLYRPTKRTEVVWVEGESELAVSLVDIQMKTATGLLQLRIPVRCDQIGKGVVDVFLAVGAPDQPAGVYAATFRRPNGPPLVVATWGDALVAFAWQCVLGLVAGVAGAVGKDERGNVLVPVELVASQRGLHVVPMARHRFAGSTGLRTATTREVR